MTTHAVGNFMRQHQKLELMRSRFTASGGHIDRNEASKLAKEARKLHKAELKLTPQERAYVASLQRDGFGTQRAGPTWGAGSPAPSADGQGPLVDRTKSREKTYPPGTNIEGAQNRPQDKNACARAGQPAAWHEDVTKAIQSVLNRGIHPIREGSGSIEEGDRYHTEVVAELRKKGYQAYFDGEEIQVKWPGADHSEAYDISTWQGEVRNFYASFQRPPAFE